MDVCPTRKVCKVGNKIELSKGMKDKNSGNEGLDAILFGFMSISQNRRRSRGVEWCIMIDMAVSFYRIKSRFSWLNRLHQY